MAKPRALKITAISVLAVVILLVVVVALLPAMINRGLGHGMIRSAIEDQVNGTADFQKVRVTWFGPQTMNGLRLVDPVGHEAAVLDGVNIVNDLYQNPTRITGVPSGYIELDDLCGGLQPSDLIVIAGRPSMGKTSLALGMARNAAVKHQKKIGIFSLEMSSTQLVLRMLSSEARIDSHNIRIGKLSKDDWKNLQRAADTLSGAPIYIDDSSSVTVQQMRGKARRLKAEKGLDMLVVDYLQLMQGRSDAESRQQEISDISRSLKGLAKELNIPIIALSQLSRAVESRKPAIPVLADLRESGAIEQDADLVMFIYREEVYDQNTENKGIADIFVRKHRNGPTDDVKLMFHEKFAAFENLSDRETV
jgi:replicative DNA helicase